MAAAGTEAINASTSARTPAPSTPGQVRNSTSGHVQSSSTYTPAASVTSPVSQSLERLETHRTSSSEDSEDGTEGSLSAEYHNRTAFAIFEDKVDEDSTSQDVLDPPSVEHSEPDPSLEFENVQLGATFLTKLMKFMSRPTF